MYMIFKPQFPQDHEINIIHRSVKTHKNGNVDKKHGEWHVIPEVADLKKITAQRITTEG